MPVSIGACVHVCVHNLSSECMWLRVESIEYDVCAHDCVFSTYAYDSVSVSTSNINLGTQVSDMISRRVGLFPIGKNTINKEIRLKEVAV